MITGVQTVAESGARLALIDMFPHRQPLARCASTPFGDLRNALELTATAVFMSLYSRRVVCLALLLWILFKELLNDSAVII